MARQCCATGTLLFPDECPFHDATSYGPVPDDYPELGRSNVEAPASLEAEVARLTAEAVGREFDTSVIYGTPPIAGPKTRIVKTTGGWAVVVGSYDRALAAVRRGPL